MPVPIRMHATATNRRPKNTVAPFSVTSPIGSNARTRPPTCAARSTTAPENLNPSPESVSVPRIRPTHAHAAPIASAYLAPSERPSINGPQVSVWPCRCPQPSFRAISGMYEHTKHSTMPQKAERNGV